MLHNLSVLIRAKLEALANDPHGQHANLKMLKGMDASRLRIGDWRVIYQVKDKELEIGVIKVAPRGEVYKL